MKAEKKLFPGSDLRIASFEGDLAKKWFIEYKNTAGRRVRISKGINRAKDAAGRWQVIEQHLAELRRQNPHLGKAPLVRHLYSYLNSKKGRRPKTQQTYLSRVRSFEAFYQGGPFTLSRADAYLVHMAEKEGLAGATINDRISFFRSAWAWMLARGLADDNPWRSLSFLPAARAGYRYFRSSDIALLKSAIRGRDDQLWLFCLFIYYCGLRPGTELRLLQGSDLLLEDARVLVRASLAKNARQAYVRIPQAFLPLVRARFSGLLPGQYVFGPGGQPGDRPLGQNNMGNRFRAVLRQLGFPAGFSLYSWKHTGAVQFIRSGGSIKALQLQLRHHSLNQTDEYLRNLGAQDLPDIDNFPQI